MNNTKQNWSGKSLLAIIYQEKAILFLLLLAVFATLAPHPANVSPIAALGIFSGTYIARKIFLLVPVVAIFITDMSTAGFYSLTLMTFVYLGLLCSSLSGRYLLANKRVLNRAPVAILLASLGFYLISNFGVWLIQYPKTVSGILECYINALPFLGRSLLGNIAYGFLFLGSYEFLRHKLIMPQLLKN